MPKEFVDNIDNHAHLHKIRTKLLSTDGKSKVSIMVGAGFSRNAAKIEASFEGMALWDDLKQTMVLDLNNHRGIESKSVLEIGEIYSDEYGRSALDNLLKSLIPDENYEPTELYDKLLNLPWADVFTTNYDTLLERSKTNIYERNYQVVYDVSDIPTSVQPRIVKLHGSFPANRPFVFTKKDYDEYPIKFSPFVNMVQQSIMESTFLLIGFSGDDPNFKKWTSWVRENLKDHMPKIYMIGINEGEKQKQLEDKGITLIDFKNVYPGTSNYGQMYKDLFEYLSPKKKEEKTNWPFNENIEVKDLNELRLNYPGWVVLPDKIRRSYYLKVKLMIDDDFLPSFLKEKQIIAPNQKFEKNNIKVDEKAVRELIDVIWFMDIFNIPMSVDFEKIIFAVIDSQMTDEYQLNTLYLSLLKEKRLENNKEEFEKYQILIQQQKVKYRDVHSNYYETVQYLIGNNKLKEAIELMKTWEVGEREPEWGVKQACLYLKLNKEDLATNLFNKYLKTIRKLLSIKNNDYRLLSLESIILSHFRKKKNSDYAYDRLKSLSLKDCHSENEFISTLRSVKNYTALKFRQKTETFDPEITNTKVSIGTSDSYSLYESFVVSQIDEQYQFSKNMNESDMNSLIIAFENIRYWYEYYSFKSLILLNKKEVLDKLLKRSTIVYIQQDYKNIMLELLNPTLTFDNKESLINDNNALDLYSKLFMCLLDNEKQMFCNKILMALTKIYYKENHLSNKSMSLAIKRICKSLNEKELNKFIQNLIELDIPEDINLIKYYDVDDIEVDSFFESILTLFNIYYSKVTKLSLGYRTIRNLLDKLEHSSNINVKSIAFIRLLFLATAKKITSQSSKTSFNTILNDFTPDTIMFFECFFNLEEYKHEDTYDLFDDTNRQLRALSRYVSRHIPDYYKKEGNQTVYHSGQSTINFFDTAGAFFGHFENLSKSKIPGKENYYKWLDRFYVWWEGNKNGIIIKRSYPSLALIDGNDILEHMVSALKNNILSTIPVEYVRQIDKTNFERIFNELLKVNSAHAMTLIPLLNRLKVRNKYNVNYSKLLIDGANENDIKLLGLNSLFMYVAFFKKREAKLTNSELKMIIDELKNAINYSDGKLLEEAIYIFSKVIDLYPQSLTGDDELYKRFSIKYLNGYLLKLKLEMINSDDKLIQTKNDELKLLSSMSKLASILIKHLEKNDNNFNALNEWKDFIINHPLPEVKMHKENFIGLQIESNKSV